MTIESRECKCAKSRTNSMGGNFTTLALIIGKKMIEHLYKSHILSFLVKTLHLNVIGFDIY